MKIALVFTFCLSSFLTPAFGQKPVRIGIAGLSHSHVIPLLRNMDKKEYQIVGIAEIRKGEKPVSVFASLKQYKPGVYPKVDDDATILLSYPDMEGVIHASWNWPFNRKDMHVYGSTGYLYIDNGETIRYRLNEKSKEEVKKIATNTIPFTDPFAYFAAAIKGDIVVSDTDLASLKINGTVVEILDAARKSSKTGKAVRLKK